jgi:hypothetical protein
MAESVRLKVISPYKNRDTQYEIDQVITVSAETAEWLMRDASGCFKFVDLFEHLTDEIPVVHIDEIPVPPKDKMIHKAKNK